jgi:hypothetical protein
MVRRTQQWCVPAVAVVGLAASFSLSASAQSKAPTWAAGLPDATVVKTFIASQVRKNWTVPKTPWGDPDIQGNFTTKDEANTPMERPAEWAGRRMQDITSAEFEAAIAQRQQRAVETAPFAGGGEPDQGVAIAVPIHWFDNLAAKNSRPWFVVDPVEGVIPPRTPEALKRPARVGPPVGGGGQAAGGDQQTRLRGGRRETYLDRYLGDRCIMWLNGVPHNPGIYGNSLQIIQTATHVVMRYEMIHEARIIPIDGRTHLDAKIRGYLGDSRGYWDGNTLVVETTNLRDEATYMGAPGRRLRLIERFTRLAPGRVEWTMTFDDPTTWERTWTYSLPMTEDDKQIIHEYACHEGNYGMANLLSAARAEEKRAVGGTASAK